MRVYPPPPSVSCLFASTADGTVANSNTETTLAGAGQGTLVLPANFLVPGRTLRVTATGVYSSLGSSPGTLTLKVKFGSTVLATDGGGSLSVSMSNRGWRIDAVITCQTIGASGTVTAQGMEQRNTSGTGAQTFDMEQAGTTTVDTTASLTVDVTATFSVADNANTITCKQLILEAIR